MPRCRYLHSWPEPEVRVRSLLAESVDHLLGVSAELRIAEHLLVVLDSFSLVACALIESTDGKDDSVGVLCGRGSLEILLEVFDCIVILVELLGSLASYEESLGILLEVVGFKSVLYCGGIVLCLEICSGLLEVRTTEYLGGISTLAVSLSLCESFLGASEVTEVCKALYETESGYAILAVELEDFAETGSGGLEILSLESVVCRYKLFVDIGLREKFCNLSYSSIITIFFCDLCGLVESGDS